LRPCSASACCCWRRDRDLLGAFGDHAIAASSVAATARAGARAGFRRRSAARVLRQKEWTLLRAIPGWCRRR
jgi:hypothetical protein